MTSPLLRPGDIVRIRDQSWDVLRHATGAHGSLLEVRGRDRGNRNLRAHFLLPCEPCECLPQSSSPRIVKPRTWYRHVRAALAQATPTVDAIRTQPSSRLAVLPFQLEPALAVVRGLSSRILIADEVGLGKTVQAGLVISEVLHRTPAAHVLVVTPAGLRGQWRDELSERLGLDGCVIDSAALARYGGPSTGNPWAAEPIVITSLDYVKRPEVLRSLESLIWDVVAFDEAHTIAGRSDRAAAARGLADRARTVLLLTATPHSGDEEAFERLCSTGDLRDGFPLMVFRRTRHDVGLTTERRSVTIRVRPTSAEAEMHVAVAAYAHLVCAQKGTSSPGARLVASIICRRAFSSAASLARSVERRLALLARIDEHVAQPLLPFDDIDADDEEPGAVLSAPGLHDEREERLQLERLLELAQRAAHHESKLDAVTRWLRRARQPAIVFTEYRDTLATLAEAVSAHQPVLLHGGMTAAERHDTAHAFISGRAQLLLATDAASEGLNLHHRCRLVINLELPWTPVRLEQRVGRIDRIGQTRRVHAVHLVAADTTEEESIARLAVKRELSAAAVSSFQDLRSAADAEAVRLEVVRQLKDVRLPPSRYAPGRTGKAEAPTHESRRCITFLKRRASSRRGLWIYRLGMVDADGQFVWDTLLGIAATVEIAVSRTRDLREWVASHEPLASFVSEEHRRLLTDATASIRASFTLAARRERAIVETLTDQRARLAAALLQRGLFDRRAERTAAAQTAIVDEALGRCTARLHALDLLTRTAAEPVDLRFAALSR